MYINDLYIKIMKGLEEFFVGFWFESVCPIFY